MSSKIFLIINIESDVYVFLLYLFL
jgi:hypothetical protein